MTSRRTICLAALGTLLICTRAAEAQTTRVSVASGGAQANGHSAQGSISADGRLVAFTSRALGLVADKTTTYPDVFVHDRDSRRTVRVSTRDPEGNPFPFGAAEPAMSGDGRFVAFSSLETVPKVFLHNLATGRTTRVSEDRDGRPAHGMGPSLSHDGRFVAFHSLSGNLVPGDTNRRGDNFVRDMTTGRTNRVSVASDGTEVNGDVGGPVISADGRYIAFDSAATTLVAVELN